MNWTSSYLTGSLFNNRLSYALVRTHTSVVNAAVSAPACMIDIYVASLSVRLNWSTVAGLSDDGQQREKPKPDTK